MNKIRITERVLDNRQENYLLEPRHRKVCVVERHVYRINSQGPYEAPGEPPYWYYSGIIRLDNHLWWVVAKRHNWEPGPLDFEVFRHLVGNEIKAYEGDLR